MIRTLIAQLKNIGRALIPKPIFRAMQPIYHGVMARLAAWYFGNPSRELYVIGVTGTAGKSTTVMMTAHILNGSGKKTGYITTAGSSDGSIALVNKHGLSMPGGWMLQRQLREMVKNDCTHALVECTSEGLAQNRHMGIVFQAALFTNLSPAHIDSHGSFENYRQAKGRLFSALSQNHHGITILGVNKDDPNADYFSNFHAKRKFGVSTRTDTKPHADFPVVTARDVSVTNAISFNIDGTRFTLHLFGTFNVSNALLAIEFARQIGIPLDESAKALETFNKVPGRMETIPNNKGFTVIVDYAPEPAAMRASLESVIAIPHNKIVHVFGSTGGHRDVAKRFEFGKISANIADIIIITNDDVYDSDPEGIARNIQEGIAKSARQPQKVEIILDRKEAMSRALSLAGSRDIILITGKGSEQFLVLPQNRRIEWDDREIVKELLAQ